VLFKLQFVFKSLKKIVLTANKDKNEQ